ncbi:MAG: transporter substrate-binding domain-containing protein [Holdemania massiliensis]
MKSRKVWMSLISLGLLMMSGCQAKTTAQQDSYSTLEQRGKVVVGIDDTFAPMGFRDENSELIGYDIDMAQAVSEKLGLTFEFQTIDWSMKETELTLEY